MKSIFKKLFLGIMGGISILVVILTIYLFYLYIQVKDIKLELTTPIANNEIYSADGKLILKDNYMHQYIVLDDISLNLINAIIATEDQTFFENNGINPYRIAKAGVENIISNKIVSGASTITQQYVKNTYLNNQKTYDRKIKEILISLQLTKKYTKQQILEAYLNSLLFGGSIYGVGMASKYYFNKTPKELSISEAAMLAGMIQLPNAYNPYKYPENANKRKNMVLKYMLSNNFISLGEYETETKINVLSLLANNINYTNSKVASYLDYLNSYTITNNIYSKEIHTYLDCELQTDLYDIVNNKYNHFNNDEIKCAIVCIDNATCGVIGLIGNKNNDALVYNYALAKMQPGSTIKPLLDYAPAFEYLNMQPSTIILDEEYSYTNGSPIKNWDRKYKGKITLRYALKDSRNIPALKLYQMLYGKNQEFINNLGLCPSTLYEADSIGGSTIGYSLLDITTAYSAFANMGEYGTATPVKHYYNNKIKYNVAINKKQVMKKSTAFFINSILHDVFANTKYDLPNTYLMAKTGQTNYDEQTRKRYNIPETATKDSWLIAYTKDLTVGIWVGYDKISETTYLKGSEKQIARKIMYSIMNKYAKPNQYYSIPGNIVKLKVFNDNGQIYLANGEINAYYEYFYKNNIPLTKKRNNDYLKV